MHTQARAALISPGPEVTALRVLFGEFLTDAGNRRRIAAMLAGSDVRYDTGTDPHPLTGYFLGDLPLSTGGGVTRLAELTRLARPLLLNLTGDRVVAETATGWQDRVDLITAKADLPAPALLVRPDGYVAWATNTTASGTDEQDGLRATLTRWFGDE